MRICHVPTRTTVLLVGLLVALAPGPSAGQTAHALSPDQKRAFLLNADVTASRGAGKGVTGSLRLTLSDGSLTHDAGFQSIDERTSAEDRVQGRKRAGELNFVDSVQVQHRRLRDRPAPRPRRHDAGHR